jgi:transposase
MQSPRSRTARLNWIADLIDKAERCDDAENQVYQQQTGYEIPDDLKHKQQRQQKIRAAKKALEEREETLYSS